MPWNAKDDLVTILETTNLSEKIIELINSLR